MNKLMWTRYDLSRVLVRVAFPRWGYRFGMVAGCRYTTWSGYR